MLFCEFNQIYDCIMGIVVCLIICRASFPELAVSDHKSDSSSEREKVMGIIAGMISAGMSFG